MSGVLAAEDRAARASSVPRDNDGCECDENIGVVSRAESESEALFMGKQNKPSGDCEWRGSSQERLFGYNQKMPNTRGCEIHPGIQICAVPRRANLPTESQEATPPPRRRSKSLLQQKRGHYKRSCTWGVSQGRMGGKAPGK